MIKRLFKLCSRSLVSKNSNSDFVNFLGVDYKSTLSINYILKSIFGLNFFGLRLLCRQFNIPVSLPLVFFNSVQLVDFKSLLLSGSFLTQGSFNSKGLSNYLVGSLQKKAQKECLLKIRQIGFLRAVRLRKGLPVRGQRTKTNAQTSRRLFG